MKWRVFTLFALGILYVIIMSIVYLIFGYDLEKIITRIPGIYLIPILCALSLIAHIIAVKRLPYKDKRDAMEVHHRRSILLKEPYDKSFDLCLWSLSQVKKLKKPSYDMDRGTIEAKTGLNFKTFEDKITYKLQRKGRDTTQVDISSRPSYFIPILDLGRNLENIETIMDYFRKSGSLEDEKIIMGKFR